MRKAAWYASLRSLPFFLRKDMTQKYTMAFVAEALGGTLVGDGSLCVERVSHPMHAVKEGDLVLATDKALVPLLTEKEARAVVVAQNAEVPSCVRAAVFVARPRYALAKLTALFELPQAVPAGIHPTAVLEPGVVLGKNVTIGALSYIAAGARIGDNCVIHPQVYIGAFASLGSDGLIYPGVRIGARVSIGARCIAHFNASIGADGFSFVTPEAGSVETAKATGNVGDARNTTLARIASLGAVEIGDDVEIGANTSIDRGTIVSTRVGNGTKIDNQVQIGHNVSVGENCMLCGRVGIAGSAVIKDRVVLGGAVGVADHVTIGEDSVCMAMSGVAGNLAPRSLVGGVPAKPRKKMIEDLFNISRIRALAEKVNALTRRLDTLEEKF